METQLPGTIGLTIAAVLQRYRDWQGVDPEDVPPSVVRPLGDHSNNFSVLVANSRRFVIRVNRARPDANALEPAAEQAALVRAAAAGLAPALRYFDPVTGTTVCDYLEPDPPTKVAPERLAGLLKGIHSLDPIPQQLSLVSRIRHYESKLTPAHDTEFGRAGEAESASITDSALELESRDRDPRLCHNDLLPPNCLLSEGRLWAIDWEYAAMGSRWFDIAVASIGHDFDSAEEAVLMEAYLGRAPQHAERELMALARETYRGIEALWYTVNSAS